MLKDKLAKDAKRGKTNMLSTRKGKRICYQTKMGCPKRTNVGLDQVSIVPWDWSMDDTRTYSMQRCKEAEKAKRVAQSKQGKHINIAWSRETCVSSTPTPRRCITQVVTSKWSTRGTYVTTQASGLKRPTSTSPQKAQSMAKSRSK